MPPEAIGSHQEPSPIEAARRAVLISRVLGAAVVVVRPVAAVGVHARGGTAGVGGVLCAGSAREGHGMVRRGEGHEMVMRGAPRKGEEGRRVGG